MFEKFANTPNLLLSQFNLTKFYEEIISYTPQGKEKVEDCTDIFLDCIWNHYALIGYNWKSNELDQ